MRITGRLASVLAVATFLGGCSMTLPVTGQMTTGDEAFAGKATGYLDGAGTLELTSTRGKGPGTAMAPGPFPYPRPGRIGPGMGNIATRMTAAAALAAAAEELSTATGAACGLSTAALFNTTFMA